MAGALPKVRITAEKFQGTVAGWKGRYGWIEPAEEIQHEKARLRESGHIFCSATELLNGLTHLAEGAIIQFHIAEDDNGLSAQEVEQIGGPEPGPMDPNMGKGMGKSWGGGAWNGGGSAWGSKGGSKDGSWGMEKPQWGGQQQNWSSKGGFGDSWGKGKGCGSFGQDGGKGFFGKGKSRTPGHMLDKTRITAEKFQGTVLEWKGKYGWLQPGETIEHPKATRHNGRIFCSMSSLMAGDCLEPGSVVEFHIAEDVSGLAAEEVSAV